jgi:2-C-methyl-D-erythritol 4-phosphate cytidylyltransferase
VTCKMYISLLSLICLCSTINGFRLFGSKNHISSTRLRISEDSNAPDLSNVAVILLAGGKGKRMKSSVPKQFLPLLGKPVFLRSLDIFRSMGEVVSNIIIVLDESYRQEFEYILTDDARICWADPGVERQDSVFNGLNKVPDSCSIIAVHDAARPLVTVEEVTNVLNDGIKYGAAVLGVPMKATVKESEDGKG